MSHTYNIILKTFRFVYRRPSIFTRIRVSVAMNLDKIISSSIIGSLG